MTEERGKVDLEKSETLPFIEKPFAISDKEGESAPENETEGEDGGKDTYCGFWIFKGPSMQR